MHSLARVPLCLTMVLINLVLHVEGNFPLSSRYQEMCCRWVEEATRRCTILLNFFQFWDRFRTQRAGDSTRNRRNADAGKAPGPGSGLPREVCWCWCSSAVIITMEVAILGRSTFGSEICILYRTPYRPRQINTASRRTLNGAGVHLYCTYVRISLRGKPGWSLLFRAFILLLGCIVSHQIAYQAPCRAVLLFLPPDFSLYLLSSYY